MWKFLGVIPAKAGIQSFQAVLDPGFRRGDVVGQRDFPLSNRIGTGQEMLLLCSGAAIALVGDNQQ